MLEFLFMVCQDWNVVPPVMRKVQIVKPIIVCTREPNIGCSEGHQVVFSGQKSATVVRDTSCMYITKDNIRDIDFEF